MTPRFRHRSVLRHAGFTMIEIMVALLIFSIGLIGIAGLLASVIKHNQSSIYHSVAVTLATDISERIRANPSAKVEYITKLQGGTKDTTGSTACIGSAADCSPTEMADFDAANWQKQVGALLPGGRGVVCHDASNAADDGNLKVDSASSALNTGCDPLADSTVVKLFWDETRVGGRASAGSATDEAKNTQRYVLVIQE